jgi:uncharacterized membrane protein YqjE
MNTLSNGFIALGFLFLVLSIIISIPLGSTTTWDEYYILRKLQKAFLYVMAFCFVGWSLIKAVLLTAVI